jgi:hypothetical protein
MLIMIIINLLYIPDPILNLYIFTPFFIQVISPSTDKIAPGLARAMERETNLSRIFKVAKDPLSYKI